MRLIFFGNPKFALPSLERIASSSHEIACVVTSLDRPAGRGRKLHVPEVKAVTQNLGLPLLQVDDLKAPGFLQKVAGFAAALFIVVAFRILPPELFSIPKMGAVNLHASLLPMYRGAAPINRAIMAGETVTGVTTFQIKKKVDTGDMLLQREEQISQDDTFDSLHDKLSLLGADVLLETIDRLESGDIQPVPQDQSRSSKAPKLKPEDGEIDWSRNAVDIRNHIRGLCSSPGAYTMRSGSKLKVFSAEAVGAGNEVSKPGEVHTGELNRSFIVATGDQSLQLLEVQPAGKKRMTAEAYLRGYPLKTGEVLG